MSVECAEDVKKFCSDRMHSNNFMMLDCLQDNEKTDNKVSEDCHHFLWNFKVNLTKDIKFDKAAEEACRVELTKVGDGECKNQPQGEGKVIPCLVEYYDQIETPACQNYINKMATIIFSDYRFMDRFMKDCFDDIKDHKCGRLEEQEDDDSPHSQGLVVNCLNKQSSLRPKCKKQLLLVAELQADDYHLDRPLYYACKDDREVLCAKTVAGDGRIFKCLYKQIEDPRLSSQCKVKLEDRQRLIAEDVKADKSFYEACKNDIKKNHCAKKRDFRNAEEDMEDDLRRTDILLCLEDAQNKGTQLEPKCVKEMFDMRSELMQDYKISPELVSACKNEIDEFCDGLDPEGESVHCLMEAAKDKASSGAFSASCRAAVENLLEVVNPGEDLRLDQPMARACGNVVASACGATPKGHGDIVTCLLDNLDHEDMTDECEERLLEIQYFAVRNFRLDHHLFKQCRKDAKELCPGHDFDDRQSTAPQQGPLLFSCLHRLYRSEDPSDKKPSRGCIHEIRRVMRERGSRINLHPEVEDHCLADLAQFCSENDEHMEKGKEMQCLQENYEELNDAKCQEAVGKYTEETVQDVELDQILMRHCTPMIKRYCQDLLDSDAMPDDVLNCLVQNKHAKEMDSKCAVGIEHHQLISLKDFKFNRKFKEACEDSVKEFCKGKKTKYDVVACLSETVRNDTLMEKDQRIDKHCRRQLRAELLERSESIRLDPELEKVCQGDVANLCKHVQAGEAQVIDCLKHHKKKLSAKCHEKIFKREQDAAVFNTDYTFLHVCKPMIKAHCRIDQSAAELFACLKKHKEDFDFDEKCRQIVVQKEEEEAKDYRLDPLLYKACHLDIDKFCAKEKHQQKPGEELDGIVLNCLKHQFARKKTSLSRNCEHEVKSRIKEAAMDINMNPVVMKQCRKDIKHLCMNDEVVVKQMSIQGEDEGYHTTMDGVIIECLKKNFKELHGDCKQEIAYMIAESRIDVHIDPLLNSACQKELITLCSNVPQGQGRQMSCLLANLESNFKELGRNCAGMLTRRKELWESAAQVAPAESFSELYEEISASPQRHYFFGVFFTVVGIIFIFGLTCGRVTKRVRAEIKNK